MYCSPRTASSWNFTTLKQKPLSSSHNYLTAAKSKLMNVFILSDTAFFCLSLHLSIHVPFHIPLIILSFVKTIHHSPSSFFPPLWTMAKMCLCVPFLGTGRNAPIVLSLLFFSTTFYLQKNWQWRGACLHCRGGSQNRCAGQDKVSRYATD